MSPEDFATIKALLEQSPFVAHLGFVLEALDDGRCELSVGLRAAHANSYGALHGGVVASLVDTASGVAAWTRARPGERVSTVELKVNFIAGVEPTEGAIRAVGTVLHRGRSTAVVESDVSDDAGRRIARGLGTFFYLPPRETSGRG